MILRFRMKTLLIVAVIALLVADAADAFGRGGRGRPRGGGGHGGGRGRGGGGRGRGPPRPRGGLPARSCDITNSTGDVMRSRDCHDDADCADGESVQFNDAAGDLAYTVRFCPGSEFNVTAYVVSTFTRKQNTDFINYCRLKITFDNIETALSARRLSSVPDTHVRLPSTVAYCDMNLGRRLSAQIQKADLLEGAQIIDSRLFVAPFLLFATSVHEHHKMTHFVMQLRLNFS